MKKYYLRSKHKSALTVVEITITSSLVVILGILLLYIANNWYFGSAIEVAEEVDKNIQIIRSALMIERIDYDVGSGDTPSSASLTIRNVAKDDLSLRIMAVDLVTMDNRIIGRMPLSDRDYILRRGERLVLEDVPTCGVNQCRRGDVLRYRVWYAPERYVDGQSSTPGKAVFVESSFVYMGGEPPLACPTPKDRDYIMIDIVDPILMTDGIFDYRNEIHIRPAIKSGFPSKIDLTVYVESLDESVSGFGGARSVRVPSSEEIKVTGDFSGIEVPLRIKIESPDDVEIIQKEWIMGGRPGSAFVSGINLLWRETDHMVHTVVVMIAAPELPKNIKIKISVKLVDCLGNNIAEVKVTEMVPSNMDVDMPVFIKLPEPIRFDQIYSIEVAITEVGETR